MRSRSEASLAGGVRAACRSAAPLREGAKRTELPFWRECYSVQAEALARNLGMEVLNETPPLKRLVAKVAMGGKLMPF